MLYDFTGEVATRGLDRFAPVGTLPTSDGYVAVIIPTDEMWRRFCAAVERPDLLDRADLATVLQRSAHFLDTVVPEVEAWTRALTRRELVERLAATGLPRRRGPDGRRDLQLAPGRGTRAVDDDRRPGRRTSAGGEDTSEHRRVRPGTQQPAAGAGSSYR